MASWGPEPSGGDAWGAPSVAPVTQAKPSKGLIDTSDDWEAGDGAEAAEASNEWGATQATEQGAEDAPKPVVDDFTDVDGTKMGWGKKEAMDYDTAMASRAELADRTDVPVWSSEARKYEWKDEYGEVGPEDPELEHELFEDTYRPVQGELLGIADNAKVNVDISGEEQLPYVNTMDEAGLHPLLLQNLKRSGYTRTTPIQAYTIPAAMAGKDVLGVSQTGSGKTVAYLAPILSKLMGKAPKYAKPKPNPETYDQKTNGIMAEPLVLIVVPTRELSLQIYAEARRLCYRSKLRPSCVYGGGPKGVQINDLMRGCDILIGTPGRLSDIITTASDAVSLVRLRYTVFDEADELMDMDWEAQMAPLLTGATAHYSDTRQYLMFSATFSREAREAAKKYLDPNYYKIVVGRLGSSSNTIHQIIVWAEDSEKRRALVDLLQAFPVARTMIFCATIDRCNELDDFLYRLNFPSNPLHGRLTQREREEAMTKFRRGSSPILVTTHLGGRGIDVENVQHIINYDMPSVDHGGIGAYNHQIGRTGRIGNYGQATSLVNDRNDAIFPDLAKILLETGHELPEFLVEFAPSDGLLTWEDTEDAPPSLDQASAGDPGIIAGSWGEVSAEPRADDTQTAQSNGW